MMREKGATVTAADMSMSLFNPLRSNSVVRKLLSPQVLFSWPSRWIQAALASSFWSCVEVQRGVIINRECKEDGKFDVLIGSSWGGAVACALLAEGTWSGPALLMCPALNKLGQSSGSDNISGAIVQGLNAMSESQKSRCLLIHGDADDTVPLEDSMKLAEETGIKLEVIEGGTPGMSALARDGRLLKFAERVFRFCNVFEVEG